MIKTLALILLQIGSINQNILSQIETFQNKEGIKNGIVSVHIQDCTTGNELVSFNADKSVNSASILKLLATGAILKKLGPEFKFRTDLSYSGEIINGKISGDLIITSDGDPSLGSDRYNQTSNFMMDLILFLQKIGINSIEGDIRVIDPDFFKFNLPDTWIWGDMGNYYGAIPHQFNFNENLYQVYFDAPYKLGEEVTIQSIKPFSKNWEIINNVKAGPKGSGDQVYIYAAPNNNKLLMKGTVPAGAKGFAVKGSIPHPASVFKEYLIGQLANNSIKVENPNYLPQSFLPTTSQSFLLNSFYSPPLKELITDCNFQSINLYADAFVQKVYAQNTGEFNLSRAAEYLQQFWSENGATMSGFSLKDGSGLSPSGLVTGRGMTSILEQMSKDYYFDYFFNSIPIVGKSGTVKYLDRKNITNGNIHAKSGSITGTRAYAGYSMTKNGHLLAFSLIVNRYEESQKDAVKGFLENILINTIYLNQ